MHQWTPVPGFLAAAQGDKLEVTADVKAHLQEGRFGVNAANLVDLQRSMDAFVSTFARFTAAEWEAAAAQAGVSVQTVRSPEEALHDELLVADGSVTEVKDRELGPLRQVGRAYRLSACSWNVRHGTPVPGEHTAEVLAEADAILRAPAAKAASPADRGCCTK